MKILTIIGARPQFIKAAVVSRELAKYQGEIEEVIVHTGQHFDYNMSDIFFEELEIPKPQYNLGISGGSHGKMTGEMLTEIEKVLQKEKPDLVLVYGDTNSTMAGALAAVKLLIPVCHVESGGRIGTLSNPEEVNRIVTDHISSLLLCCTKSHFENLKLEGKTENRFLVGDPMYDAFKFYSQKVGDIRPEELVSFDDDLISVPEQYYYLTCHRQENTYSDESLMEILSAMNELDFPSIYPVHPRNRERVRRLKEKYGFENIIACKPVGYLMSVYLTNHAEKIVTDSGGLQREAFFAGKQCVTVFDYVAWPETMVDHRNQLSKPEKKEILQKLSVNQELHIEDMPFGDGNAAAKIVRILKDFSKHVV